MRFNYKNLECLFFLPFLFVVFVLVYILIARWSWGTNITPNDWFRLGGGIVFLAVVTFLVSAFDRG